MSRSTSLSVATVLAVGMAVFATASSAADTAVPVNQSPPTLVGAAVEGGVLSAHHGRWQSDSSVSLAYQWRRCLADGTSCADIPSATDRIYTSGTADVGHTLRVTETATNRDGSAAAPSSATSTVTALPTSGPHNTVPPTVAGSPVAGGRLVAANGSWTGTGPFRYSYQWRRCSSSGGDCGETSVRSRVYRPSSGDVNRALRVLVIARGPAGTAAALSSPTARIAKASSPAPQNRSLPAVQGLARQGERLSADRGSWANSPSAYAYTWLRCDRSGNGCAAIPGAHGSAYIATPADIGHTIRLQVDARNAGGLTRAFSPPTAIVAARPSPAAKPANTVRPSIAGTAQEGKTLTGNQGSWTNNPTGFDYSWHRCDHSGDNCGVDRLRQADDELHAEERRHRQDDPLPRARTQFGRLRQGRAPARRPSSVPPPSPRTPRLRRSRARPPRARRSPAGTGAGRTGRPRTRTPGTAATATATTAPRSAAPARAPTG